MKCTGQEWEAIVIVCVKHVGSNDREVLQELLSGAVPVM